MSKEIKKIDSKIFDLVARVYGVPAMGITSILGQPYLNKDGRLFLLKELRKDKHAVKAMRVEFLRLSTSIIEPSIAKKTIVFNDGTEVEAMGEASKDSVGSDSVKKTLNMVAETRALNRAIWQAIGGDVMERVDRNIHSLGLSDEEKEKLMEVSRSSAEEMDRPAEIGGADEKEMRMYEAIIQRIDEVQGEREKLKIALKKLETFPIDARHKQIVEEKINVYLSKIRIGGNSKKKVLRKVVTKKRLNNRKKDSKNKTKK